MGKTVTIANACSHNLYVKIVGDIGYQKAKKVGGGVSTSFASLNVEYGDEVEWKTSDGPGYALVNRHSCLTFTPDTSRKTVYITIKKNPHKEHFLCENFNVEINSGLIINSEGYTRNAKKGKKWIDTDGIDHEPCEDERHNKDEYLSAMEPPESQSEYDYTNTLKGQFGSMRGDSQRQSYNDSDSDY